MISAAYATINIAALHHNLQRVRTYAPQAKIMAVIKANAYGHGMVQVAEQLSDADAFAVARVQEGVRLRKAGICQPIAVLEGFTCAEELDDLLHYQLDAVVHSVSQLEILEHCQRAKQLAVWLKIDTGMNRLGFQPQQAEGAYQRLMQCACVAQPLRLMTHLACADNTAHPMTTQQLALFQQTTAHLAGERSIANSAGILAWNDSLTDWVRPGVMLYGISPFTERAAAEFALQPVMSLQSRLIAVKPLARGASVGYGAQWHAPQNTLLGVIAIGYGDGYPRYAQAGTPVLVNGKRVPLIGRVSMDMITVDLGSQPNAQVGDAVTLWGERLPIEEIAHCANTIPYTLVCGITQRVKIVTLEQ